MTNTAGQRLRTRKLHPAWVNAAQRRPITRALRKDGFTYHEIAEILHISYTTIWRDLRA